MDYKNWAEFKQILEDDKLSVDNKLVVLESKFDISPKMANPYHAKPILGNFVRALECRPSDNQFGH